MTEVRIRGWKGNSLAFDETAKIEEGQAQELITGLATRHATALASGAHLIEIEFLDEPDPLQRFFRFGTDPRRMVAPLQVRLFDKSPLPE